MGGWYRSGMPFTLLRPRAFPELSYASPAHPRLKRWFILAVEQASGRSHLSTLYDVWRRDIAPTGEHVFSRMLELLELRPEVEGEWPPRHLPEGPLVIVANHPFGIADGIAILSLAETLGRPFRVMINADLMKVPEIQPYALPVDFSETREAQKANITTRHEAMRCLKDGITIVVFPAGGVATAARGFGRAEDLPWKLFPARLIQEARANVIPVHFSGQNGWLFHAVSRFSLTARIALLIRELRRLCGRTIRCRVGTPIAHEDLSGFRDRKELTRTLRERVLALGRE